MRLVDLSADLDETDLTQAPGPTRRRTELERDGNLDVILGVQTSTDRIKAFAELSFVGTTGAVAGLSYRF